MIVQSIPEQIEGFISASNKYFGVDSMSRSARRRVVTARIMLVNFLIRNQGITNATISEITGLKHPLIIYYLDRHDQLIESDNVYRDTYVSYKNFLFN